MLRIGLKRTISLTKRQWTELAETGNRKDNWSGWKKNGGRYDSSNVLSECFLCEYNLKMERKHKVTHSDDVCPYCLFYAKYGRCTEPGQPYKDWHECGNWEARKVCAKQCLKQLQEL